jgi:hypothetical protein
MLNDSAFTRLYRLETTFAENTPYEYRVYRRNESNPAQP